MKVAVIGDIHVGVRNDREAFHQYFELFFNKCFFPELARRGINTVIQLGDLFDRRKYISFSSLKRAKEYLFEPLRNQGILMYSLVGNHDIALRNSTEINAHSLLLQEYTNVVPITTPTELTIGNQPFLLLPWICDSNQQESLKAIRNSAARYCCGHLEIATFTMYRGTESLDGYDPKMFEHFDIVFSGHFHHRNSKGNIRYVGAPCEHTHMDQGDIRGFEILDTETGDVEFVENPHTLFEKVVYDDTRVDPRQIDVSQFQNKFVKLVVTQKSDYFAYDTFIQRLYNAGAHDIRIMDTAADMTAEELDQSVDIDDTQTILSHYIETADVTVDRNDLKQFMNKLYIEALHIQQ